MRTLQLLLLVVALPACSSSPATPDRGGTADLQPAEASRPPDLKPEAAAPAYDFSELRDYLFKGSWVTNGVVVMKDGKIVYEEYAHGYDASKRHYLYSVSKSIGSALAGIAIGEGLLDESKSLCDYLPPVVGADPTLCDTTVGHLLTMTSGLAFKETYESDPSTSNVIPMLYGGEADMGLYTAKQPRAAKAGTVWSYSSGDANLLARVLRGALKGQEMRAWAKSKLFDPAGLSSAIFEADRSGSLVFASWCFLTPRDMARFGQLYLDDGMVGSTRVLPAGWVKRTITPAPPVATPTKRDPAAPPGDSGGSYGASFWLNATSASAPADTWRYPEAPVDTYSAQGHWGQRIFIVPSRKLVIARTGFDRAKTFDSGPMVGKAVAAIDKGGK